MADCAFQILYDPKPIIGKTEPRLLCGLINRQPGYRCRIDICPIFKLSRLPRSEVKTT